MYTTIAPDAPRLFVFETPSAMADDTVVYRDFVHLLPQHKRVFDRPRLRETVSAMVRHTKAPSYFPKLYPGVQKSQLTLHEHQEVLTHYKLQATNMSVYLKHEGIHYGVVTASYMHYWHNHVKLDDPEHTAQLLRDYQDHFQQVFDGVPAIRVIVRPEPDNDTQVHALAAHGQTLFKETVLVDDTSRSASDLLHHFVYPYFLKTRYV